MTPYESGQVRNVLPWVGPGVEWFLLGGPADGDEAQVLHAERPDVRIVGFEPNPRLHALQRGRRAFPGRLLPVALWDADGTLELHVRDPLPCDRDDTLQGERSGSLTAAANATRAYAVAARRLDGLSAEFGPFRAALLWLDIERAELRALRGAAGLLAVGAIRVVNAEVYADNEAGVRDFLAGHGLREVGRWNHHHHGAPGQPDRWDVIYARDP